MSEQEDRRRFARADQVRVMAEQERREGRLPDMRKIEKEAHARADRIDAHQDRGIKGSITGS